MHLLQTLPLQAWPLPSDKDVQPLHDVPVFVGTGGTIRAVRLPLIGESLLFQVSEGMPATVAPEGHVHGILVLEW